MLTVCLIYSRDRLPQAVQVVDYLQRVSPDSQKLLISDGETNFTPAGYTVAQVKRKHDLFCRGHLWNCAVALAKRPTILIMDCDRLPHPRFFTRLEGLKPDEFVCCRRLYQMDEKVADPVQVFTGPVAARPDFRVEIQGGTVAPRKNPMSGCVAFPVSLYGRLGGMDASYLGWGFNDTDFYMTAWTQGCEFTMLDLPEYHLKHSYTVKKRTLMAMNIWNGIKFYDKWRLPIHEQILEALAAHGPLTTNEVRGYTLTDFINL